MSWRLVPLEKSNDHRICHISNNWIIMLWGPILGHYHKYTPKLSNIAELKTALNCYRYGMINHRSSLIRQSNHFERNFDRVLLQQCSWWTF